MASSVPSAYTWAKRTWSTAVSTCRAASGRPPLRPAATASQSSDGSAVSSTGGAPAGSGAAGGSPASGTVCTSTGGLPTQPRASSSAPTGAASGSGVLTIGG